MIPTIAMDSSESLIFPAAKRTKSIAKQNTSFKTNLRACGITAIGSDPAQSWWNIFEKMRVYTSVTDCAPMALQQKKQCAQ